MEGATHKQVVELIKEGGDRLVLVVVSVHPVDAEKLDPGPQVRANVLVILVLGSTF